MSKDQGHFYIVGIVYSGEFIKLFILPSSSLSSLRSSLAWLVFVLGSAAQYVEMVSSHSDLGTISICPLRGLDETL